MVQSSVTLVKRLIYAAHDDQAGGCKGNRCRQWPVSLCPCLEDAPVPPLCAQGKIQTPDMRERGTTCPSQAYGGWWGHRKGYPIVAALPNRLRGSMWGQEGFACQTV